MLRNYCYLNQFARFCARIRVPAEAGQTLEAGVKIASAGWSFGAIC
jgi:hypothetical protein